MIKIDIIIDSREPKQIQNYLKKKFKDISFDIKALPEGDFQSEHVLCERKTVADLYSSILDKRLWAQVNRMSTHTDKIKVLLVVGNLDEYIKQMRIYKKRVNKKSIANAIVSINVRYNFVIMWIEDDKSAYNHLIEFMLAVENNEFMEPARAEVDTLLAKYFDITLPQMRALMKKYPSLKDIMEADNQEIISVRGIGEIKAKRIKAKLIGGYK